MYLSMSLCNSLNVLNKFSILFFIGESILKKFKHFLILDSFKKKIIF